MSDPTKLPQATTRYEIAPKVREKSRGEDEGGVLPKLDSGEMFTVNDTALAFLGALDGKTTFDDAIEFMLDEFEVAREVLEADMREVVRNLSDQDLIRIA